jgi:hypothetical protein
MADMEMEKFKKSVEQLCGVCAKDVVKLIDDWVKAVEKRTDDLANDIAKIPVPAKTPPADLEAIPDLICKIVEQKGAGFSRVVKLIVHIKIDSKARTMRVIGTGITSPTYS